MIIRKVDGNRCAIGGGSLSGSSGLSSAHGLPCAPHEQLGEAVAQFRPMALEIYTDPAKARSGDPKAQAPSENTFLACLGDTIGLNRSREARKYPHPDGSERSTSPVTPLTRIARLPHDAEHAVVDVVVLHRVGPPYAVDRGLRRRLLVSWFEGQEGQEDLEQWEHLDDAVQHRRAGATELVAHEASQARAVAQQPLSSNGF